MQVKIRTSATQPDGSSTWSELWVTVEDGRVIVSVHALERADVLKGVSMRGNDARVLAAALFEAANLAEQASGPAGGEGDFPP